MDRGSIICGRKIGDGKRDQCGLFDSSGFFSAFSSMEIYCTKPPESTV